LPTTTRLTGPALALFFCMLYLASFKLNAWLFTTHLYTQGVAWVFVPAGIKLLAVLVARGWGVLGIALAGMWMAHADVWVGSDWLLHAGNIAVWLLLPYLVIMVLVRHWQLEPDLSNFSFDRLFVINAVFTSVAAVGSSAYAWWVYDRREADAVAAAIAMAVGDFVGTLLVMGLVLTGVLTLERLRAR
jgi:hypothetical protein